MRLLTLWISMQAFLIVIQSVFAQTSGEAVLKGSILDENGARVTEAELTIVDSLGRVSKTQSDQNGEYRVSLLEGIYKITARKAGFCPEERRHLALKTRDEVTANLRVIVCAVARKVYLSSEKQGPSKSYDQVIYTHSSEVIFCDADIPATIQFGKKTTRNGNVTYHPVTGTSKNLIPVQVTSGLIRITAQNVSISRDCITALGRVVVEDGRTEQTFEQKSYRLENGQLGPCAERPDPK